MRILVNGLSARLGGGQTYLRNLLRHVPHDDDWRVFVLAPEGFELTSIPDNVERCQILVNLENPFRRALWEHLNLGELANDLNADLLFSPGGLLPVANLPRKLKTVVTFQNMLPFDHKQRRRYPLGYRRFRDWLLERGLTMAMRRADLIIFISTFAREFIESRLDRLDTRSVVIPHGIDAHLFAGKYRASSCSKSAPKGEYFLYVSFIDSYKSQIEVVRAFARVREQTGTEAMLVLAGAEYGPYGDSLRREIISLGIDDAVQLTGNLPHSELPALYQHARLNLFASCTENCPNILLEMMASGRPALVSNRGPMPEFGGSTVTYFDPEDIDQFVGCWIDLLENPAPGERLAARAVKRISTMGWKYAAETTWGSLEAVVKS